MNRTTARLMYSASESDANMLWATRFFAPDPFIFIEKRGKRYLVMSDLEIDRARQQAEVDRVLVYSDYVRRLQDKGVRFPTVTDVLPEVLRELQTRDVDVPSTFPLGIADALRRARIRVNAQPDPFWKQREIKSEQEIRYIRESLNAAERGIEAGIETVKRTTI